MKTQTGLDNNEDDSEDDSELVTLLKDVYLNDIIHRSSSGSLPGKKLAKAGKTHRPRRLPLVQHNASRGN